MHQISNLMITFKYEQIKQKKIPRNRGCACGGYSGFSYATNSTKYEISCRTPCVFLA